MDGWGRYEWNGTRYGLLDGWAGDGDWELGFLFCFVSVSVIRCRL